MKWTLAFQTTHCVACCGANIEVFEELWGAPILSSYLLSDLCCHSPAKTEETSQGWKRVLVYAYTVLLENL